MGRIIIWSSFRLTQNPGGFRNVWRISLTRGTIPLIAHPERYFCIQDYPELVYEWIQNGCITQMNKGSILGRFGRNVMETARILLRNDLISCIASDAHRSYIRTPHMGEAKTALVHIGGYGYAWHLTDENPERIIKNIQIPLHGRRPDTEEKIFYDLSDRQRSRGVFDEKVKDI